MSKQNIYTLKAILKAGELITPNEAINTMLGLHVSCEQRKKAKSNTESDKKDRVENDTECNMFVIL